MRTVVSSPRPLVPILWIVGTPRNSTAGPRWGFSGGVDQDENKGISLRLGRLHCLTRGDALARHIIRLPRSENRIRRHDELTLVRCWMRMSVTGLARASITSSFLMSKISLALQTLTFSFAPFGMYARVHAHAPPPVGTISLSNHIDHLGSPPYMVADRIFFRCTVASSTLGDSNNTCQQDVASHGCGQFEIYLVSITTLCHGFCDANGYFPKYRLPSFPILPVHSVDRSTRRQNDLSGDSLSRSPSRAVRLM